MKPSQENEIRQAVENRYTYSNESWLEYATALLAEVDRLRAAVEAVRALPSYGEAGGWMIDKEDVLAALEVNDGD